MLPDTIVEDVKQHLIEDNRRSIKYTGHEIKQSDYEDITAGYMFELLNYNEYLAKQFRGKKEGTPEWEAAEAIVKVSSTLCRIARDPQEYGVEIDIRSRIPDGVYVGMTKEGDFNIYGLAEAKLGNIDRRALEQVRLDGSRTTMAKIVEQIDEMIYSKPEEELHEDLVELKKILQGNHLKVKWKEQNGKRELSMSLELLIPTRGGTKNSFVPQVYFKERHLETEFDGIKKAQNITPKNSPFSADEVHFMAQRVLNEIE
jgi:hypothetical protein